MLLKKVWESVLSTSTSGRLSSGSRWSNNNSNNNIISSSTGDFDRIPDEILGLIFRKLGPKESAKLCLVCKTWRNIVISDNRLWIHFFKTTQLNFWDWDSIVFSETLLNSNPNPDSAVFYSQPAVHDHQLSLINIYGLRAKVPGALIVDGGSGYCKFGWSKYPRPSGRSATFLEFGNIEAPMYSRLRHFYSTIYTRMQVKSTSQPIVVSIPICHYDDTESAKASRRQLKGAIYSALFDMNVPVVCAISQATLALYAARRTSGIVVNIGFHQTSVVPILHGKVMRKVGIEVVGMGALKLTGFLREQMQQQNISFESLYTVRELKENLCYVALDYDAEFYKDSLQSYEVPREGVFTLSKERFLTGEILFQPRIAGVRAMGLHQAVALCMDHCYAAELMSDDNWFKTVVLCGGSACLPGLAERLEKELRELLPLYLSTGIRVIPPPYGLDSAWHGARLISNLSTFPGAWCMTKKQMKQKLRKNRLVLG
ncbi:actin-related protein 8 [Amaranthus tricolor]|uniref:actin-related protein 8 n=1 Tax=Amaranthus tricolor TaxID=29722 RepID=UPI0025843CC0|nr:actin-related protein 8 [Amaranthus tricolor]XP_057531194.1 actin-related protein 8 [Amaranthus tricolor]